MKTKFNGILTLVFALLVHVIYAQEKTVSGNVSDESGPLPGVSVIVEGTSRGTETDFDGNFTLSAKEGEVLRFSFLGMSPVTRKIGAETQFNISMVSDANTLEEVVITGLGIKREKQALGYAVSEVDESQLSERADGDIGRVLNGKASGVNIQAQSGISGSGTSIIIRGYSTFSGSNQPLFIVDGVPFSSETNPQGDFVDGNNGSSRFLDIDPNNIESVNVLKGLAAATLYGTQGRNGVILITTKAGSSKGGPKKSEVTVSTSFFINEIASMPNYQNDYGNGFDQAFGWFFSNWGPSFSKDGPGGWGNDPFINGEVSGTPGFLRHPYSTASSATGIPEAFPEYADALYEWKSYKGVENFFRQGNVAIINVNATGASEDGKISYNMNYGNLDEQGFTPGNTLKRNTFSMGGRAILSNKFTVGGTLNYANTKFTTPPVAASNGSGTFGTGESIFGDVFYTPRSIDLMGLPYQNPITGGSVYYRQNNSITHPLWTINNSKNIQDTHRVFGGLNLQYDINDHLFLTYRYGIDVYSENNTNYTNKGAQGGDVAYQSGIYETWNNTKTINDHNIGINGMYDLGENFDISFAAGATTRRDVYDRNGVSSNGQQVFGVLRHFNFANQDEIQYFEERNILGVYGQAEIGYQDMLYVTLAGRQDWVSNLSSENNSILYPSASISWIPTKTFTGLSASSAVNFLKLRAGYGTSANFPTGYPVSSTLTLDTQDFQQDGANVVTNTTGTLLGNPNLKPERLDEIEFGVEARLFQNRVSLDASVYRRTTKDLIVDRPLDPSTGYTLTQTNIGQIDNDGIEIDLGVDIIRSENDGFNWNMNFNWTKNEAIVKDLGLDTDIVVYAGFSNLGNAAIKGESIGTMIGTAIDRDENGNKKVNAAGDYVIKNGNNIIGDANPDFVFNASNSFSFKNWTLGFLFTWTEGGDMYAYTPATLLGRGMINDDNLDRENSFILPGVNPQGEPNTTMVANSTYYFNNVLYGPDEMLVYDATVYRLQELSLSYSLPNKYLKSTPFGAFSVTLSGNNLWYNAPNFPKNSNFDPNVAGVGIGNGRGFEYLNGPSSKKYGISVKASF